MQTDLSETQNLNNNNALEEALLRFDAIYNSMAFGIAILDDQGTLTDCNALCREIFGINNKQEWIDSGVCFKNDPNFSAAVIENLKTGKSDRSLVHYDFDIISKHNFFKTSNIGRKILEIRTSNLINNNKHREYVMTVVDVTASKQQELAHNTIYDNIPIGIELYNREGQLEHINPVGLKCFGIDSRDNVMGISIFDNPNTPDSAKERIRAGEDFEYETEYDFEIVTKTQYFKTNSTGKRYLSVKSVAIRNEAKEIEGYMMIKIDITKRKEKEKADQDLNTSLEIVMDAGGVSVWKYDIAERKFYSMLGTILLTDGTTYEECLNAITDKGKVDLQNAFEDLISGRRDKAKVTLQFCSPEIGKDIFCKSELGVLFDTNGNRTTIIGTQRNITKDIIQKRRLEEFKIKTNLINEKNHIIQWDYNIAQQCITTQGNGAIEEKAAMDKELYLSYVHPDDRQTAADVLDQMSRRELSGYDIIIRTHLPDYEEYRHIILNAIPIKDAQGNIVSYTGIRRDATDDILQRKELNEKTYKTALATKASGFMPWEYDCIRQVFISNDNDKMGREMLLEDYIKTTHPSYKSKLNDAWDVMREGRDESFIVDIKYEVDREWRYATISGDPYEKDSSGKIIRYIGYRNNTTDLILMNESIKENKFKTDMAIKNAKMVMWEYVVEDKLFTAFNDPLTNYDATAKYSPEEYIKALDPDSVDDAVNAIAFMNRQEVGEFSFKSKIMLPNSSDWQYITIYGSHSEVSLEDPTKATKYIGFRIDNTELVNLSQSIDESNTLTSNILTQSPSAIFIKDISDNWKYVMVNDLFCQIFDYPSDKIIGYNDYEAFNKEMADKFREDDLKAIEYDGIYSFIEEVITNGKPQALHTTKRVTTLGNGRKLLIGISSDITETIKQQRALEKSHQDLKLALEAGDVSTWLYNVDEHMIYALQHDATANNGISYEDSVKLIHPDDKVAYYELFETLIVGKQETGNAIFRYIANDVKGGYRYYENRMIAQKKAGRTAIIIGTRKDITDDVLKTKKLENTQKYLDLAIDAGNVAVWGYDPREDVIFNISGRVFEQDVIPFSEANDSIHPDDQAAFGELWEKLVSGESHRENLCIRFKNPFIGKFEYVDKSMIALRKPSGELDMIIGTHHDVTEDKEQKMALEDSNGKLNMALDVIQAFSWHCDQRDGILQFDSNFSSFGLDPKTLNSMYKFAKHVHPDDQQEFFENIDKFITDANDEFASTFRIDLRNDGNYEWWERRGKIKTMFENGQPYKYIYGMDCNVTHHKQITDELIQTKNAVEEANTLLQSIIRQVPFGLYIKDINNDFRYVIMNDVLASIDGIDSKDVIGRTDYEIFENHIANAFHEENINAVNQPEGELTVVKHIINWNGKKCIYENSDTVITVANGRRLLIGVVLDVTEKDYMLNELKSAKERAEQSDKLKSAFLANMSHEIRTPLNAIIGFSEMLIEAESSAEREEYTNIISVNNELLLRLIGDILDLSKIESGMIELTSEEFDLSDICDEVYTMLKQKVINPNINFTVENPYYSCMVNLDKNRLKQVGINFITNAIKYTERGNITMGYKYDDNGIKIYVVDTGIGIAKENYDKVFERFEKFDSFAQGTGLGLSICRAIVEAQGGKIGFTSEYGKGSTFWAWFPCKAEISMTDDTPERKEEEVNNDITLSNESKFNANNFRILIAEDNDSNYRLIEHLLKDYDITRARDGAEAVQRVKTEQFNAVLMDWKMPIMDGLEATIQIRKFNKDIPIIAVTANAFDSNKISIIEAGCNTFVAKPLKKNELINAISIFQ